MRMYSKISLLISAVWSCSALPTDPSPVAAKDALSNAIQVIEMCLHDRKEIKIWLVHFFFFSCYLGYFRCTKGNHSHYFGLDWWARLDGIWNCE